MTNKRLALPAEAYWAGRGQFRCEAEAGGGQQLEAGGGEAELGEDSVKIEDSGEEHPGGDTLTLTHLANQRTGLGTMTNKRAV